MCQKKKEKKLQKVFQKYVAKFEKEHGKINTEL